METRPRNHRFVLILRSVLLAAIAVLAAFLVADIAARLRGREGRTAGEFPEIARVPEFTLSEARGGALSLADLRGKVWVADFIFTHCSGTCPLLSNKMQKIQEELKRLPPELRARVRLVSFSVDPERDRPERLAQYAGGYRADPELWLFAVGGKGEVEELAEKGFRVPVERAAAPGAKEEILHSTRLALVDARGTVRAYYSGVDEPAIAPVLEGIRRLLAEADSPSASAPEERRPER